MEIDDICEDIENLQSSAVVGLTTLEEDGLLSDVANDERFSDFMICRFNLSELLCRRDQSGTDMSECFLSSLYEQWERCLSPDESLQISETCREFSNSKSRLRAVYTRLRSKTGRRILLVVSEYELLLTLPSDERRAFTGEVLFELCEAGGQKEYGTTVVLFSSCPIWWCEYEDVLANQASLVCQRTMLYVETQPSAEIVEALLQKMALDERRRFLQLTELRQEPYL